MSVKNTPPHAVRLKKKKLSFLFNLFSVNTSQNEPLSATSLQYSFFDNRCSITKHNIVIFYVFYIFLHPYSPQGEY